jgi:hypothetical protein
MPDAGEADWEREPLKAEYEASLAEAFIEAAAEPDALRRSIIIEELYGAARSNNIPLSVINRVYMEARGLLADPEALEPIRYEDEDTEAHQLWPPPQTRDTGRTIWFNPGQSG